METSVLKAIKELNATKVDNAIAESNGALNPGDITTTRISLREISECLNVEIGSLYDPLDYLMYEGHLIDHSNTNQSWGRSRGADGQISSSISHCVELSL